METAMRRLVLLGLLLVLATIKPAHSGMVGGWGGNKIGGA